MCNVSTKCGTREDFVAAFAPFVDDTSLFIPARIGVEVGQALRFQIILREGAIVYAGHGEVQEVCQEGTGPLGKSGVRVRLVDVDPEFRVVRDLLARRRKQTTEATLFAQAPTAAGAPNGAAAKAPIPVNGAAAKAPAPVTAKLPPARSTKTLHAFSTTSAAPAPRSASAMAAVPNGIHGAASSGAAAKAEAPPSFDDPTRVTAAPAPAPRAVVTTGFGPQLKPAAPLSSPPAGKRPSDFSPEQEQRAPGSPYKLPANPLSEMSTNALDFFVEATLTEDESAPSTPPGDLFAEAPAGSAAPAPAVAAPAGRPAAPAEPPVSFLTAPAGGVAAAAPPVPLAPASPRRSVTPVLPVGAAPEAVLDPDEDADPLLMPVPAWRRPLEAILARLGPDRPRAVRLLRRWVPSAAAAIVGLVVGFIVWGGSGAAPVSPPAIAVGAPPGPAVAKEAVPPTPEPAPAAPAAPAVAAGAPAAAPPAEPQLAPAAAPRPVAPPGARCLARIESQPRGATVKLGRKSLGRTPIGKAIVPCGEVELALLHPRYRPAIETFTAAPEAPVTVSSRLTRPSADLLLSSSPEGATFKVNGHAVGRAPRKVSVLRFETIRVEAELEGQKPWRQRLYVKEASTRVQASFPGAVPKKAPAARRR